MKQKFIFNERIIESIKSNGYTQKELADMLNISQSNITNWKNGDSYPNLELFFKICVLLDESADYLLGLDK